MRPYIVFAIIAGCAWGVGGYFEKAGLKAVGIPPIAGITLRTVVAAILLGLVSIPAWKSIEHPSDSNGWMMIIIGGGLVAGSIGMWSFYSSLAVSENLGVTLAIAFALSPIAGTCAGLLAGNQHADIRTIVGLVAIILGIILVQMSHKPMNG
jgi:transporter family protein